LAIIRGKVERVGACRLAGFRARSG